MRSLRIWIPLLCTAVPAAGAGARLLLSEDGDRERPISVGTTDVVGSLDPAGSHDTGYWALYSNLYQSPLTLRPGSAAPVPDAAESCCFPDASLTAYACTLRAGLTFANGRPLTAQDVRFSFERMLGIATDAGPATLFAGLDSVSVRGCTVTFGAWRRGGVEVAYRQLPPDLPSTYEPGGESGRMTEAAAAEIRTVVFDLRSGSPLAERAVRQAVAVLVDRGRITTRVHHSTARTPQGRPVREGVQHS
ncbi:ABC transporter substrate-binding protein [Streptomyces sp. NPDC018055]|uniref:ABC transporter substrate-binding protein n=1 Tax=Streptomyces sp. NPDC018055 TaxID=3365038 RepID=UPI003793D1A5